MLTNIFNIIVPNPIFIIGTGRAGTHWIGYTLANHKNIRATIETQPIFNWVTTMALNQNTQPKLFNRLTRRYCREIIRSLPKRYLDKSDPNIWIAEKLQKSFPSAQFIGIERNPYSTISSMIQHEGVSGWHSDWDKYPIPNKFLGITIELGADYDKLTLAQKCALRWEAHHNKMNQLQLLLGKNILVLKYEALAYETENVIYNIQKFLNLKKPIPKPKVLSSSLDKWKSLLSDKQVSQIRKIVNLDTDEWYN